MSSRRNYRLVLLLFFLSGATSLAYETVFLKLLGYVFGNTTYAVSTVLAAFMGGLAIGSLTLGRLADRRPDAIRIYGLLELGIGVYCALVPFLFRAVQPLYVTLYQRFELSLVSLTIVRFALSSLIVLPPTILMGGTLPVLARSVIRHIDEAGGHITKLYAINTLGAAFGVFFTTYFLIERAGVVGTLALSIAANVLICIIAFALHGAEMTGNEVRQSRGEERETRAFSSLFTTLSRFFRIPAATEVVPPAIARLAFFSFASGFITLGYEVIWTHLLHHTAGTSVYAFGIMLTTMLLGIAAGSFVLGPVIDRRVAPEGLLAMTQLGAGVAAALLLPAWDDVPKVFLLSQYFRTSFAAMETLRFIACFLIVFVPALLLGMTYPLVAKSASRQLEKLSTRIGVLYFWNTVGAIFGSTITGFVILGRLGGENSLRVFAIASVVMAVLCATLLLDRGAATRNRVLTGAVLIAIAVPLIPSWDRNALNLGAHVYGVAHETKRTILWYHEDVSGGVTTVVQDGAVRTLQTNAKFQGNDGGEMTAQRRFALDPIIFLKRFDRAMVIGLGTGVTAHTVGAFPFREIDVAEISPGIIDAARRYFSHVNGRILEDPRVTTHLTDGRNLVQLSPHQYDLISIELTSVWFAGAAGLYSRDFYEECRAKLAKGGVIQQWIQIHHIQRRDLLSVMRTMRSVFPHVAFFMSGGQGVLVASPDPLSIDFPSIDSLSRNERVRHELRDAKLPAGDLLTVLGDLVFFEETLTKVIATGPAAITTDLHPFLEYSTPKGNQLPDTTQENIDFLESNATDELPPILRITAGQRLYLEGVVKLARGRYEEAASFFHQSIERGNTDPRCAQLLELAVEETRKPRRRRRG